MKIGCLLFLVTALLLMFQLVIVGEWSIGTYFIRALVGSLGCGVFYLVIKWLSLTLPSDEEIEAKQRKKEEKIKALETKARSGDLVALEEWKELTGRTDRTSSWFFFWWS